MAKRYCTTRTSCLQVMVPSGLRAKQVISYQVNDELDPHAIQSEMDRKIIEFIRRKQRVSKEQLLAAFPNAQARLRYLLEHDILVLDQKLKTGVTSKQELLISLTESARSDLAATMQKIPARATKQKAILEYLWKSTVPIRLKDLLSVTQASRSTIDRLEQMGLLQQSRVIVRRDPYQKSVERDTPLALTSEQANALQRIISPMQNQFAEFLLQGVTGSGKTEVYLQAMERCLDNGKQAIVLVPEISLTPQTVDRFKRRFGDAVAVLHSRLSQGERYDEWLRIRKQKVKMVVGARSAIFAPFERLGLIIIDEEHESSYKQEDPPKYVAHEIAKHRAKVHQAVLVYGSATPGFERMQEVRDGTIAGVRLRNRVFGQSLPQVEIVDMRNELKTGNRTMFSGKLRTAIESTVQAGNQIILFLNRRGHSTFVLCRSCGDVMKCPHCEISLTLHKSTEWTQLRCHYCGYARIVETLCPTCGSPHIRHFGTGTQKVEEALHQEFPGLRVIRMDVDTTQKKGSHERLLEQFRKKQADVLLGTQMIAKGLDFPDVTLVGVITADTALNMPDYRAGERTFQLLSQVAGRAGRHTKQGIVVIQTYNPDHYVIQAAARQDYDAFFEYEIGLRKNLQYPPFVEFASWIVTHESVQAAEQFAHMLYQMLTEQVKQEGVQVMPPTPAPFPKLNGKYRYHILMKYTDWWLIYNQVRNVYIHLFPRIKKENGNLSLDVNAQTIL
jgi:primosomal protein N' (replication factor Y) (superfamily II helicase)